MCVFIGKACEAVLSVVGSNLASLLSRKGTWELEEAVSFFDSYSMLGFPFSLFCSPSYVHIYHFFLSFI